MFKKFIEKITDLIYPNKCVLCNENIISRKEYVCEKCLKEAKPVPKLQTLEIEENPDSKVVCVSAFRYIGNLKNAIWRFKFRGHKKYSGFFARKIVDEFQEMFKDYKFDYICFVPLRKERERNRGYNQAQCIASDISSIIGVPCKDVLVKIKNNHVQHELDLIHRRANVKGAYGVKNPGEIQGKRILLCDDIVTSGSTLAECAKTLLKNGASSVCCCTVAYIPKLNFSDKSQ